MDWKIRVSKTAEKHIKKLDSKDQKRILDYLTNRVAINARNFGKELRGEKAGLWRYRVGNYRIICHVKDDEMIVLVLIVGHRREVYK